MKKLISAILLLATATAFGATEIGAVDTEFKLIGPNHKVVVEVYDDPVVKGVACYLSHAKAGGIKGAFGLAEDKSEMSIACRQTGKISFNSAVKDNELVFSERISPLFKHINIFRMVDRQRNVLVYLTTSDRLINGSPQNSVTAVAVDSLVIPK